MAHRKEKTTRVDRATAVRCSHLFATVPRGMILIKELETLMRALESVVCNDPEVLGGTPVFTGTRVPVKNLIDCLAGGDSLDQFLDDFPSVSRPQAIAALELAKDLLISRAHSAG